MPPLRTKTEWRPKAVVDLRTTGAEPGTCDKCGRKDLRYLHELATDDGRETYVGSECAKRLCWGYDPQREESRLKNLWARRNRWLLRNWGTTWNGNQTLVFKHDTQNVRVTIFPDKFAPNWYCYCIAIGNSAPTFSRSYRAADEAKLAVFDVLAEMLGW